MYTLIDNGHVVAYSESLAEIKDLATQCESAIYELSISVFRNGQRQGSLIYHPPFNSWVNIGEWDGMELMQ